MIDSASTLVETLRESQLLTPRQLHDLGSNLEATYPEARSLARELLQRGWLTAYQVNRILKGEVKDLFLGPYILLERLGEGGMGQVFKARHRLMNRVVALKVIRKERLGSPGAIDRFLREIQLSAQLSHPHIVIAHDAAQSADVLYFAMEYVEGSDLDKLVRQRGALPAAEACDYIRQAALGLQHAHERGLVHRDIKPHNLLVSKSTGQIKILDLGLARLHQADTAAGEGLTHEGVIMGTPDYMAPEQALDTHGADIRADVYSLGCTLYTLLAGQAPFARLPVSQKVGAHISAQPQPIEEVCPLPEGLGDVLRKMMAKRPQDRYQTPAEVAAVLETFSWRLAPTQATVAMRPPASSASQAATIGMEGSTPIVVSAPLALHVSPPLPAQPAPQGRPPSAAPFAVPDFFRKLSRRQLLIGGAVAGLVALSPLGLLLRGRRRPGPVIEELEENNLGDRRYPWYPREVIQVLGDDRGRHWGAVRTLAFQPGGGLIASGGDDGVIRFWSPETLREERRPFRGHTAAVRQVVFTPDGKSVISLGNDGTMRLWDVDSGEERHRFAGSDNVTRLFFSADGQWVRGLYPPLNILSWNLTTTEQGPPLNPPYANLACWQVSADGRYLAIGEYTPVARTWYHVRIWNLDAGKEEYPPVLGPEKPRGYEDLPAAERAKVPARTLTSLALAGSLKVLLGADNDRQVFVWDPASGNRRTPLPQQHPVLLAALDPHGQRALLYTQDGTLALWDLQSGKEAGRLEGHRGPVVSLAFSADSPQALTASEDRTLRLWDLDSCKELHPRSGHTHLVQDVMFSADGKQVLTGGADRTVRLWDVADGKELHKLSGHKDAVTSVAFLGDGSQVFSYERSLTARLWDVAAERILFSFNWPAGHGPTAFRYSDTAPHALVGTAQGDVMLYDLSRGKPLGPAANPSHIPPGCLALSEDRALALMASFSATDCFVRLIDLAAGRERLRLPGHTEPIFALAFLSGATRALSAGQDRTLRRWDLQGRGRCEQEIELEGKLPKVVTSMSFSPDITLLACTGYDETRGVVLLWDTETGRLRASWEMLGPVQHLVFARDSTHLATANANGTVFIYRLDRSARE